MSDMPDVIGAIARGLDAWDDLIASMDDLIASMARTQEYVRRAIIANDAAVAEINASRAARGLPPVGDDGAP